MQIKTSLQVLSLKQDGTTVSSYYSLLPEVLALFSGIFFAFNLCYPFGIQVEIKKQRTAFPPNFVHSLDGSHMMMTAVACRDAGLCFAGLFSLILEREFIKK